MVLVGKPFRDTIIYSSGGVNFFHFLLSITISCSLWPYRTLHAGSLTFSFLLSAFNRVRGLRSWARARLYQINFFLIIDS